MANFNLENGLFYTENTNTYEIPAMNERSDGVLNFDETVAPYLSRSMTGDYEVTAKFIPVNMSLGDSYGIYIYSNEDRVHVSLQETPDGTVVASGAVDFMETENPAVFVENAELYLKIKKEGDVYEEFYSPDGEEYISCGKNILTSRSVTKAGFKVNTFQGSSFYLKLEEVKIR